MLLADEFANHRTHPIRIVKTEDSKAPDPARPKWFRPAPWLAVALICMIAAAIAWYWRGAQAHNRQPAANTRVAAATCGTPAAHPTNPAPPAAANPATRPDPPRGNSHPDWSRRESTAARPMPEQVAALAALRAAVPGVRVDFDALTGAPSQILAPGHLLADGPLDPADPAAPVKAFLDAHAGLFGHDSGALRQTRVTREDVAAHSGMRTTVWQQEVDGIPLYNTILRANVTQDGGLVALGSCLMRDAAAATGLDAAQRAERVAKPAIDAHTAISLAAADVGDQVDPAQAAPVTDAAGPERKQRFSVPHLSDTTAELCWLPMKENASVLAWDVTLMSLNQHRMFRILVDAQTGVIQMRTSLTNDLSDASYRVYADATTMQPFDSPTPMSPGLGTPAATQPAVATRNLITTPALDTTASPNGWIPDASTATYGNNVDVHLDLSNSNPAYGAGTHATSASRVFDFTLDLAQAPANYQNAAMTQLFYLCNWYHDKMYGFGFTESAGNFQQDNFSRGGLGNDAVLADAQDGGGTNNANFSTPVDGSAGRMQMYIFTGPTPYRDGSLDAEVVLHEFTHGLSNRLVGGGVGMSQLQSEGMGEGWSDFYALCLLSQTGDAVNGNYASGAYVSYLLGGLTQNYYYGIRRYPYTTDMTKNPLTLKDIDPSQASAHSGVPLSPLFSASNSSPSEVHCQGEVWCMVLWDARANLVAKLGAAAGNQMILQLVTDGMKLSPVNPTFLQARDAIIQADLVDNAGANRNELWAAFAKRGMGSSATAPASSTTTGVVESYDMPDNLGVSPNASLAAGGVIGGPFSPTGQTYTLTNNGAGSLNWTVASNQGWLAVSPASGTLAAGATASVTANLTAAANSLSVGGFAATLTFTDITTGVAIPRQASLTVTPPRVVLFDLTTDPGWARQGEWAFGTPTGGGGSAHGHPDPTSGATGTHVFGINLGGDYATTAVGGPYYLTTGAIDLTNRASCQLRFKRWLNSDWHGYANQSVDVSNDGTNWTSVWQNAASEIADGAWTTVTYDISSVADNHSTVYVRWGHQIATLTDLYAYSGWNIDDVEFLGVPMITLAVGLASSAVTEGDAPTSGTITVSPAPASALVVGLVSGDPTQATVPASVTIPAGQTTVSFPITIINDAILDGTQYVTITGTAAGYPAGSAVLAVQDNETATLAMSLPATTSESSGSVQGTVTVSAVPASAIVVTLISSDPAAATAPATVTIPAGQTSANFTLTIIDDNKLNGTHDATITAHVANWTDGAGTISISDNENTNLTLTLPPQVIEGGTASGTVAISGTRTSPLTVALASNATSRLTVPATVTIPAGAISTAVTLTAPDNTLLDGSQVATVTASASGFTGTNATTTVMDNDAHHYLIQAIASPQSQGVPFSVTITAQDANNATLTTYTGTPNLTASGSAGAVTVTPTSASGFVNGVWTGNITVSSLDTNIILTVTDSAGRTGASNPFNMAVPPDYFTELFDTTANDVSNQSFLFTPNGTASFYSVARTPTTTFPTDPTGGTALSLSDDSYAQVTPTGGAQVKLYGVSYTSFYVGSNGYVTFGSGDTSLDSTLANHFSKPRIAMLLDDLNPGSGGTVSWRQLADRVVVTYQAVPEYGTANSNNFQTEMYFDGRIRITCLGIADTGGLIGLSKGTGTPAGFIESDFSTYPTSLLSLSLPASATEGSAPVTGTVTASSALASAQVVNLGSSDTAQATVPATVTIPAGQTSATFPITIIDDAVLDGTQYITVTASASGFASGQAVIAVNDNETATLNVTLPATTSEGAGSVQGTVTMSTTTTTAITVTLLSSDPAAATVPATAIIPAGQTSANFTVTIIDDNKLNGTHSATISAHMANWTDGSASISIADNENTNLTLNLPTTVSEGGTGTGTVAISGSLTYPLTVALVSDVTSRLTVPATVTIAAGATSATFTLTAPDNSQYDGTRKATISASTAGFTGASVSCNVLDNDVHHFVIAGIATAQYAGTPFNVMISAKDINDVTIISYAGTPNLSAANGGGPIAVTPTVTTAFGSGVWTGGVTINTVAANVVLTVSDGAGHTGSSNAFNINVGPLHHFTWGTVASPQGLNDPFTATLFAKDAGNNTVTGYGGSVALNSGTATRSVGTGTSSSTTLPFHSYYHDERSQCIYLQSEIGAAGTIRALSLNVTTLPGQTLTNWTIRMKHTALASYSTASWDSTGWTTVYQANQTINATGWVTFTFTTPFAYNGTSNLMVDFSFNNSSYTSSGGVTYTAASATRSIYYYTDSGYGDPLTWSGTSSPTPNTSTTLPNLSLLVDRNIPLLPAVTGNFTGGVWTGAITVQQVTTGVSVHADDGAGHTGDSNLFNVVLAPEIVVEQPAGTDVADGGTKSFGNVLVGSNASLTFTVKNTGTASLTGLTITTDGANPGDFSVTAPPVAPVAAAGSTAFVLRFTPAAAGSRSATIHIASNDSDENPFDITLTGTGTAPEIVVEQPAGSDIADGGSRNYGNVLVGSNTSLTFTIKNTGTATLTGLTITKDGANPGDFSVTALPVAPVVAAGSTAFVVRFTPAATGTRSAAIHIASNDSDENPFDISLTGTGATALLMWASAAGLPPGQSDPLQAPQNDGLSNLIKYACNLNPLAPDHRKLSVGAGGTAGLPGYQYVGGKLRVEFLRRKAGTNPGISYTPQFSSSIGTWTDFTGPVTVTSIDGTWERVVADDPNTGGARYGRVKVVQSP